jgi:ribose 5-phosphate isomerase RpiB
MNHDYDPVSRLCKRCGDDQDAKRHRRCHNGDNITSIGHRIVWRMIKESLLAKAINKAP